MNFTRATSRSGLASPFRPVTAQRVGFGDGKPAVLVRLQALRCLGANAVLAGTRRQWGLSKSEWSKRTGGRMSVAADVPRQVV